MSSNTTASRNNPEYWCHQCETEIRPLMAPHPVCPNCNGEFVEQIEADNDPRTFVDHDHTQDLDEGLDENPVNLDDLFRLFQAIYMRGQMVPGGPIPRTMAPTSRQQQGAMDAQFVLSFGGEAPQTTATGTTAGTTTGTSGTPGSTTATPSAPVNSADGHTLGGDAHAQHPDIHAPSGLLGSLLERLGIHVHYTTNPEAFGSLGGGIFNMVGDPGDYVFSQNGLDNIITQLMEQQSRQNGPIGATDETIGKIPHHKLTQEEQDAKLDCSVCKDEFTKEDSLLQLECKHIFHEDCLKPWLKMSGTCPTCRFSIITDADREAAGHPPSSNPSAQPGAPGGGSGSGAANSNNNSGPHSSSFSSSSQGSATSGPAPSFSLSSLPGAFPSALSSLFGPRSTAQTSSGNGDGQGTSGNNNNNQGSGNNNNSSSDHGPHPEPLD